MATHSPLVNSTDEEDIDNEVPPVDKTVKNLKKSKAELRKQDSKDKISTGW